MPFGEYFFSGSKAIAFLGTANIFIVVGIPIFSTFLLGSRLVFKKRLSPYWKAGMWSFWAINLICMFLVGSIQSRQFSRGNELTEAIDLSGLTSDTLVLSKQKNPYDDALFQFGDLTLADDFVVSDNVRINIEKSEDGLFELVQTKKARGQNGDAANRRAKAISYEVKIDGNQLIFPEVFPISKENKWRAQGVEFTLKIPTGKTVRFEDYVHYMVHHSGINRDVEHPWIKNEDHWVMEDNGLVNKDWLKKNKQNEEYDFKDFSQLQIDGNMKVMIEKGDQYKVAVTGKSNYLKRVEVVQLDKTLSISTDLKNPNSPIRLYLTMPNLQSLDTRGTDDVKIQGFSQAKMTIKNEGTCEIKAFVNVDSMNIYQEGRGQIDLRGKGKHLKADLDNRGKLDSERFDVNTAEVYAKEYSKASLAVSEAISIKRDDLSKVSVDGEPKVTEEVKEH